MFVITELEDDIEIRVALENKKDIILDKLNSKYVQKLFGDLGKAVSIYDIVDIKSYEIHSHMLLSKVIFRVLFYRFYPEEICTGRIVSQDENGILIDDGIFKNYRVYPEFLFENSEFVFNENNNTGYWVWNYENNKLQFCNEEIVRFRIKEYIDDTGHVSVFMDEQGLGPCVWWD